MKVKSYFKKLLIPNLKKEIDCYIDLNKKPNYTGEDVITYNEVAMVSFVMAAFVRNENVKEVSALQEYEVFKEKKFKGRGDLFVALRKKELTCDLLIEAKRDGEFNPKEQIDNDWHKDLKTTMAQGKKYFAAEKDYFATPTFVVTMFFGTLKKEDFDKYDSHKFPVKGESDTSDYKFYIKPKGSLSWLCVYGQIQKVK